MVLPTARQLLPKTSTTTSTALTAGRLRFCSTPGKGREDNNFNEHNLFFARYDYNKVNTFTPPGLGTNAATGLEISGGQFDFDGPATDTAQQYGFGFTRIFTQKLLVDLRAAFTRINNLSLPLNSTGTQGADAIVSGGLGTFASNLNSQSTNLTPISFPGLSDIGDGSF